MERRERGRPRSERADAAIRSAALELLGEGGVDAVTFEAVARRARVGRPTIYRRWKSPLELIADALESQRPRAQPPKDTGSLEGDLARVLRAFVRAGVDPVQRELLSLGLSSALRAPALRARYWERHLAPRRAALAQVFARAVARGELDPTVDLDLLLDVVGGAWTYLVLVRSERPTRARLLAALRLVLAGAGVERAARR